MYEFVKSLLPKEVLDITDVNHLRDLREFFDERVQEEKQKQENSNIDKYRPIYEGKIMLSYGKQWDGPIAVQNLQDIEIVKVNKLDFVGHGFIRADADVLNLKYMTPRHELKAGLTADNYGEITIDTYHDSQYSIPINDDSVMDRFRKTKMPEPQFLTLEAVKAYIDEAETRQKEQIESFKTKIGLK